MACSKYYGPVALHPNPWTLNPKPYVNPKTVHSQGHMQENHHNKDAIACVGSLYTWRIMGPRNPGSKAISTLIGAAQKYKNSYATRSLDP